MDKRVLLRVSGCYLIALAVEALGYLRVVLGYRGKGVDAAERIPADTCNHGLQEPFIGCELLESADSAACVDDGHEVIRLHLFIDKFFKRLARVIDTCK